MIKNTKEELSTSVKPFDRIVFVKSIIHIIIKITTSRE
jgi:hypothetical protein